MKKTATLHPETKRKRNNEDGNVQFNAAATCGIMEQQQEEEQWLVDSGSTVHITKDPQNITNWTRTFETIIIGNGEEVEATMMGTIHLQVNDAVLTLHKVLYIPLFAKHMISAGWLVQYGSSVIFYEDGM